MRLSHFSALRPVCPVCRTLAGTLSPLGISLVEAERNEDIIAGVLGCSACGAEYPIIDGMPVLVPDVRRYVQDNLFFLMARDDLTPAVESLLGDAAGLGSGVDSLRQHVSSYMWDHWGDCDPDGPGRVPGDTRPGCLARNLHEGLTLVGDDLPDGPILDIGCGAGRTVVELARTTGRQVLGIDISVPLARVGRKAAVEKRADYSLKRAGLVYERRRFALDHDTAALNDVWICDVLALPFSSGSFALASAMNVLDCVRDPRAALIEISRVLTADGKALLSIPFDWSGHVTPPEAWLGGHSQRAPHGGDPEAILAMLLSDGPLSAGGLRQCGPAREVAWQVRLHDRSVMHYSALLTVARNHPNTGAPA